MTASTRSRAPGRTVPWLTLTRFVIVIASLVVAFWHLRAELIEDVQQGSDIGYVFAIPVLGILAAVGMALRRGAELPIYDRQTDIIVGLLGLLSTAALLGLLVQRYRYEYEVLHLDIVAAPLFLLSMSILLFGLRPVLRFWPVWLLVMLMCLPVLYRYAVITLGGSRPAHGVAMLVPAAVAAAIATGRTRRRALAGGILALIAGGVAVFVMRTWFRDAPLLTYELIPPIAGTYTATTIMYFNQRGWTSVKPLDRAVLPHTAKRSWSAAAAVVFSTGLLMLISVPHEYLISSPEMPRLVVARSPEVVPGWQQLSAREYPWAKRFFGSRTTWVRQQWQAQRGNPAWDKESRRRRIMVDIVRSDSAHTIERYPEFMLYRLNQPRVSPPIRIDLGHGITARLNTVLDDRRLLSWTWLSWYWQGPGGAQRISLISADNHLPDAAFPQPEPSVLATFENLMNQILRGNAVVLDPESDAGDPESEHKDRDMLTGIAREIVRTGAGQDE
ncbi:hypothetical protein ACIP5Y_41360 [Nocardia sp. NPDC088792]|uniref:hypothetical protein n=1 Tax=Nocardia sp. NPDC088792 TaxID=3364332 RepID=UPI0038283DC1